MGFLAKLTGKKSDHAPRTPDTRPVSLYRGVRIVPPVEGCCRTARTYASQRFLADEIPKLPLEQCDAPECRCTYKLFDDRRTGERRLSDFGYDIISQLRTDEDQRDGDGDRRGAADDETAILARLTSAFR